MQVVGTNEFAVQCAAASGHKCRKVTRPQRTDVSLGHSGSAGDLFRQEGLGRAGIVFDGDRPALVLTTQLGD